MKKRVIAVFMAVIMTMSMAACGDKDVQESLPVSGTADQSEAEGTAGGDGENESEEDVAEINSKGNDMETSDAMAENSETAEGEAGAGASDVSSMFADVDWDVELYQYEDFVPNESYKPKCDNVRRTLTNVAMFAIIHGNTGEEEVRYEAENNIYNLGYTYDALDEESKAILERLVSLSLDDLLELRKEVLVAIHDPEGMITDVDWNKLLCESDDGTRIRYAELTYMAFMAQLNGKTVEETVNDKETVWGAAGLTYDMLDDEARAILDYLMTYDRNYEIVPLRNLVIFPWIDAMEALEEKE